MTQNSISQSSNIGEFYNLEKETFNTLNISILAIMSFIKDFIHFR